MYGENKMKSNAKSNLIIMGILFALLPIITTNLSYNTDNNNKSLNYCDDFTLDKNNLKTLAVSGKIHIDNNWTAAEAAGICTGNGTYSNPYIIEDLVIDGGGSGSCIMIENSDVYFRIENCSVYNSGGYPNAGAGIQLNNVTKGKLVINNCTSNAYGISLYDCNNNTISGNTVDNNNLNGIYLDFSDNNIISGNSADNNHYGIYLDSQCDNNNISGNSADNNHYGIFLFDNCDNNIISGNTANYNSYGIYLVYSDYNTVSGNTANYNTYGIYLWDSKNTTISGNIMNECGLNFWRSFEELNIDTTNLVNGKPLYYYSNDVNLGPANFINAGQVILVNCSDSLISNLNVSYSSNGISLYYCINNTISGNTVDNNNLNGIYLRYSDNNIISGNIAIDNANYGIFLFDNCDNNIVSGNTAINNYWAGIGLFYSINSTISGNTASDNKYGIDIWHSYNNIISGNTANYNSYGIYLEDSGYNTVSGNTANYNTYGICLEYSGYNTVSGNTANYNYRYGMNLCESNYNVISGNTLIGNDACIVEDNCVGNEFSDNGSCTYGDGGSKGDGTISGYNLFFLLAILSVAVILISKKLKKG
ncbi:MAG: hypothetical protein CEE43_04015 [Promethearchaeota archaeon Loki_b32]|nr:MAG: hypothetical protein CEE43_04015 [Candidatus Lokiarchaeota archaeon Loki_b32]